MRPPAVHQWRAHATSQILVRADIGGKEVSSVQVTTKVADLAPERYCSAFAWVRFGRRNVPILPSISVRFFLIGLACLVALILIAEWRLAGLATQGRITSDPWQAENDRINTMNQAKIQSSLPDDPLWRSAGIPSPLLPADKPRILVLGDSFVWGDGYLNVNDVWWRQLERELHRRGHWQVEVVAAGLGGASTQDELRWLRGTNLLSQVAPDLVVLGYVANDPDVKDSRGRHLVKQLGREIKPPRYRGLDAVLGRIAPQLNTQLKQRLVQKWETRIRDAYPYAEWELRLLQPPNFDAYKRVVADLGETMRSRQLPFFTVTLPNWPSTGILCAALPSGSGCVWLGRNRLLRPARRFRARIPVDWRDAPMGGESSKCPPECQQHAVLCA